MAASVTFTFRPRESTLADFSDIEDWCKERNIPVSAVFNAYLPAIAYTLRNNLIEADDRIFARSDFGDVEILP